MRLALSVSVLAGGMVILFFLLGERLDSLAQGNNAVLALRQFEAWAWLPAIGLICADLVLPVPSTSVIAALGILYGTLVGGLVGAMALFASGALAYGLVRSLGPRAAVFFAGEEGLQRLKAFFERLGAWAIVLTRGLPIVPEIVICLAGLVPMKAGRFFLALGLGSLPMGFVYAAIGAGWENQPILAMAVAYVLPVVLLPIALYLTRGIPNGRRTR